MKSLALTIGGSPFPIPTVIQHIANLDADKKFGMPLLLFGLYVLISVTIIIALAFLVWGGVSWVISEGEKTKLQAARNTIIFSIVGLITSLLSFLIINLISNFLLGGKNIFGP